MANPRTSSGIGRSKAGSLSSKSWYVMMHCVGIRLNVSTRNSASATASSRESRLGIPTSNLSSSSEFGDCDRAKIKEEQQQCTTTTQCIEYIGPVLACAVNFTILKCYRKLSAFHSPLYHVSTRATDEPLRLCTGARTLADHPHLLRLCRLTSRFLKPKRTRGLPQSISKSVVARLLTTARSPLGTLICVGTPPIPFKAHRCSNVYCKVQQHLMIYFLQCIGPTAIQANIDSAGNAALSTIHQGIIIIIQKATHSSGYIYSCR